MKTVGRPFLPELRWAPYQEFGIPDPGRESYEPPAGLISIGSIGYRGDDIIVYWARTPDPRSQPRPGPSSTSNRGVTSD